MNENGLPVMYEDNPVTIASYDGRSAFLNWLNYCQRIDWRLLFADELGTKPAGESLHLIDDLLNKIYAPLIEKPPVQLGLIPLLAMRSLGANVAESHCERMISVTNRVLTEDRTLLASTTTEKVSLLRMNKKIMELIKSDRFKPLFDQWRLAKKAAEAAAEVAAAFQGFYVPPADGEFDEFDDDAEDEIQ